MPRGVSGLRPTSARVRGAIFDRLGGAVEGMRVLDLFAGSGALSFEALSRGASHATLVERDPRVVRFLRDAAQSLGLTSQVDIVRADALQWVATPPKRAPYDLVLIDPPFATPEVIEPLSHALVAGWLAPHATLVCERERIRGKSLPVAWPRQLALRTSRAYGQAEVEFLELASQTEST